MDLTYSRTHARIGGRLELGMRVQESVQWTEEKQQQENNRGQFNIFKRGVRIRRLHNENAQKSKHAFLTQSQAGVYWADMLHYSHTGL